MAGTADGETDIDELREDLTFEIDILLGDLKDLGYDMSHIPDFLKETRAHSLHSCIMDILTPLPRQLNS
jgi:hypothetical protein